MGWVLRSSEEGVMLQVLFVFVVRLLVVFVMRVMLDGVLSQALLDGNLVFPVSYLRS